MEKRRRGEKKREPSLDQRSAKSQREGEELLPIVWLLFCALLLLLFLPWQGAQKPGADQESQKEKGSTIPRESQKPRAWEREERPWRKRGEGEGRLEPPSRLRRRGEPRLLHGELAKKKREPARSERPLLEKLLGSS